MIPRDPVPRERVWAVLLMVVLGILGVCAALLCVFSIQVGLEHSHRPGFWVPIAGGVAALTLVVWLVLAGFRRLLGTFRGREPVGV